MGMYDYLKVQMPLPDSPGDVIFQTKDTDDQYLVHYTLREDGRLFRQNITGYEDKSDPNAKGFMRLAGAVTPIIDGEIQVPFHGYIRFHHYDGKKREYWNYRAKFTDDICVGIELLEHTVD